MSRKNKNIIDVKASRKFLYEAYGMKTKEVNFYELMIVHEEFRAKFHWYHTTGKLLGITQNNDGEQNYRQMGIHLDAESVAIAINKWVYKSFKKSNQMYWNKAPKRNHRESLTSLLDKVQK